MISSTRRRFWMNPFFQSIYLVPTHLPTTWFSGFSKFLFSNKIVYHRSDCSKVCEMHKIFVSKRSSWNEWVSSPQNSNNCLGKTSKNIILEFRDIVKLVGAECLSNASPNAVATLKNVISLSISPPPLSCVYFSPRRTFVVKKFRGGGLECSGDKKFWG